MLLCTVVANMIDLYNLPEAEIALVENRTATGLPNEPLITPIWMSATPSFSLTV